MTATSHPYPSYKPSGIEWLGDVPKHWEVRRLKEAATIIAGQSPPSEIVSEYLDDFPFLQGNAEFGRMYPNARLACEEPPKRARAGDILLSVRAPVGALNVADRGYGIGRGLCAVRTGPGLHGLFAYHALGAAKHELLRLSTGSTYGAVTVGIVGGLDLALPSLQEQAAIVRYLDHVDRRVRRYVSAKRKLIALLEEEKQAVINRAVTRGLDPNVRLKPSGVEWLGDVPEDWEVLPLKRAFISMDYGISDATTDTGSTRVLTMAHVNGGNVTVPSHGGVDSVDPRLLLQGGDLLFNRTNSQELVAKVGIFVGHDSPVTFASYLVRLRPHPLHVPEYLNLVLNDESFLSSARREAIPNLHQSNLNPNRYGRLPIALPEKSEQLRLLRFLSDETEVIDSCIARARRQIELLQEYRTWLISDVVTGKLDVSEAAALLPDEAVDQDPIEDGDLLTDGIAEGLYDPDESVEELAMESEVTV